MVFFGVSINKELPFKYNISWVNNAREKKRTRKAILHFRLPSYGAIFPLFDFLIHYDITGAIIFFSFFFLAVYFCQYSNLSIVSLFLCKSPSIRLFFLFLSLFIFVFKLGKFILNKYKTESHYHNELIYKFFHHLFYLNINTFFSLIIIIINK